MIISRKILHIYPLFFYLYTNPEENVVATRKTILEMIVVEMVEEMDGDK